MRRPQACERLCRARTAKQQPSTSAPCGSPRGSIRPSSPTCSNGMRTSATSPIGWATRARTLAEQRGEAEIALRARVEIDFTRYHHDGTPEHAAALEESRD